MNFEKRLRRTSSCAFLMVIVVQSTVIFVLVANHNLNSCIGFVYWRSLMSRSGFVSNSSAHDVVAWHLCSQRLRACNNQYFSIRAVKMFGFKIGSDFSMFFESFWTVCVGLAMCLILPLRPASPLPADAPLRTSSTAYPIVCVFSAHRDCANSS